MDRNQIRTRFKAPEGRYALHSEKSNGNIPFNYQRGTRLTLATLEGTDWIIYNVGDLLNISRYDQTHKEPTRCLGFTSSAVRAGYPTCHAFASSKDGNDLLVGLGDGQVCLMSLKAQLQSTAVGGKPIVSNTLVPEGIVESARCNAVVWLAKNDATLFAAAFMSGNIYVYKKTTILGEGGSKFSLSIGSSSKNSNPTPLRTIVLPGGGVNDIAVSPDGTRLAAACRDGALRLVEVSSGQVLSGFQSYYGALLCCCFSPDCRFVAAGGEDDFVAVYGLQEKALVAHGEGHSSWLSRVQFDPWVSVTADPHGPLDAGKIQDPGKIYRIASVGQDTQLCLWDLQVLDDTVPAPTVPPVMSIRKSSSHVNLGQPGSPMGMQKQHGSMDGPPPGHQRKPSITKANGTGAGGGIASAPPRSAMNLMQPIMCHRVHAEPLSDLLFTQDWVYTADHCGCIRAWARPLPRPQSMPMEH